MIQRFKLNAVLAALPLLSSAAREEVITRCRALNVLDPAKAVRAAEQAPREEWAWLVEGIRDVVKQRGGADVPNSILVKTSSYKIFASNHAGWVCAWLAKSFPNLTRTEKLALATTLAHCLAVYIQRFREPVAPTMQNMLRLYNHVEAAVERQFPGYAANGWLKMIRGKSFDPKTEDWNG